MRVHNAPVRVREAEERGETTTIKSREESYYRVTCVTCVTRDVRAYVCACVRVLGVFSMYILYVYSLEEFFFFLFL